MPLAPPAAAPGFAPPSDREFALFQAWIEREAGIHLGAAKKALLVARLGKRLRSLGITSFREYFHHAVDARDPAERVRMLDCITTNETHFFREPRHFEFLAERAIPSWREQAAAGQRARRIRVWSAGCSTGEEPFSIAMLLLHGLSPGFPLEIVATDLSTRALARARAATWPIERAREIPRALLRRFMLRGVRGQTGRMRAAPELRALVRFERANLHDPAWTIAGSFDLVMCRNVLIYFGAAARAAVVERLIDRLEPGGYLMLGHAESLGSRTPRVRSVFPTAYVREESP